MSADQSPQPADRRGFFRQALCLALGGLALLAPFGAGFMVLLDPLRRKSAAGIPLRVATIDALPLDGSPRKFPVLASRADAWNRQPDAPIGAVYLRLAAPGKVQALNVVCPHAGCFVDYSADRNLFVCPCHKSSFNVNGTIADLKSPSPRMLDALPVELRADGSIWVTFQNYRAGCADKIPVA